MFTFEPHTFAIGLLGISLILWGLGRRAEAVICVVGCIFFGLAALR